MHIALFKIKQLSCKEIFERTMYTDNLPELRGKQSAHHQNKKRWRENLENMQTYKTKNKLKKKWEKA